MSSATFEIFWMQVQCPQRVQTFGSSTGKLVQQFFQRLALNFPLVPLAIEALKRSGLTEFQNHPRWRYPIRALPVNQVPDHLMDAPAILPFIPLRPRLPQTPQKGIESRRSPGEKRNRVLQIALAHCPGSN